MFSSLDRVVFVLSLMAAALLYGWAAHQFGWFPDPMLTRAAGQARHLLGPPEFVSDRVYRRTGVRVRKETEMAPGLTLVSTYWEDSDWRPGLRLIDSRGEVVHEWRIDPRRIFSPPADRRPRWSELKYRAVDGSHLLPDGDVLVNVEYVGTARIDACGEVIWSLPAGSHHTIAPAGDGSYWVPGLTHERPAASDAFPNGYPGLTGPIHHELLLRISGDGAVRDTVNVLDFLYMNGLQDHVIKRMLGQPADSTDVTHANDAEPLLSDMADEYPRFAAGDLLVSLRDLDLLLVVDPDSRRVKWHSAGPYLRQHDPDFMGGGWIGVFDNRRDRSARGRALGGSRILALQVGTDSTKTLFPTGRSHPFHTEVQGKWQLLSNGNLLLTESQAGRVVEVNVRGETVWDWVAEPYSSSLVPYVSGADRYELAEADVAAWPCSPEVTFSDGEAAP